MQNGFVHFIHTFLRVVCVLVIATASARAQQPPPTATPQTPTTTNDQQTAANNQPPIPTPSQGEPPAGPPQRPPLEFTGEDVRVEEATGFVVARKNVRMSYAGGTITADRVEGNVNSEIVFSGNAKIETDDTLAYADAIHFFPSTRAYRLDNPRATLQPQALNNRILDPVFVSGQAFRGTRTGYTLADLCDATTCLEPRHKHYELRFRSGELIPNQRLVLKRVAVYFFGQRLIVLPQLVIPLEPRRRFRSDYAPEFGRNVFEGYFARFPYAFAVGAAAATFLRLDATEKRGLGFRVEQSYLAGKQDSLFNTSPTFSGGFGGGSEGAFNRAYGIGRFNPRLPNFGTGIGPQNGGLFSLSGYLSDGFNRNFNGSFRHQQSIGSNNRISLLSELRRNSFLNFQNQESLNTRLNFNHADPGHGVNADASLSYNSTSSGTFRTTQITGNYRHSFEFDTLGANRNNLSWDFDLARYVSTSGNSSNRTMRLNGQFQFQHFSRDYSFSANANKSVPIGRQSDGSAFGTLERLPELQLAMDSYNFKRGWLRKLPLRMELGVGQYSEPGSDINTNRVLLGFTFQEAALLRGGRTQMVTGGGFEQRIYGDGAAQYILRNTTRMRQRLGGRSGFDLNYQYQEPAGGTPFLFDTFGRTHNLSAEAGYLDDSRFQFTIRAGYDFLGTSAERPWQSVSARMMVRPNPHTRLDVLGTFDPNTGRFFQMTQQLRLRGRNDFAFDLVARYDPSVGKYSQVNGQFDIPLGKSWRLAGLVRYNGFRGLFESTNVQLTHRWDCMEASLTYTNTPLGFRNENQLFLTVRLTAFPFFRSFARGPAGDILGTGIGDVY